MLKNSLSVVIPAYNEEKHIKHAIKEVGDFLKANFSDSEIIVVDDGSIDGTCDAALSLSGEIKNLKVLKNGANRGKGYSVKKGVLSASSDYVLFTDVDLSVPLSEFTKFEDYIKRETAGIIIGSRALKDSNVLKKQNFLRQNMGKIFNLLVRLLLFRGIKDTQCGFKCFRKDVAKKLFKAQRMDGFCFDAEILYIAKKNGIKIYTVPIKWINDPDSRVQIISGSISMLLDLFRIRFNDIFGGYVVG